VACQAWVGMQQLTLPCSVAALPCSPTGPGEPVDAASLLRCRPAMGHETNCALVPFPFAELADLEMQDSAAIGATIPAQR